MPILRESRIRAARMDDYVGAKTFAQKSGYGNVGVLRDDAGVSVSLFDMVFSLSAALDLIDYKLAKYKLVDHHHQVCYIATRLAMHLGCSAEDINDIYMAGLVHDIGAVPSLIRSHSDDFELKDPYYHSEMGARLLSRFERFRVFARLVRFHHYPWNYGKGKYFNEQEVPVGGHILHLADRISVLLDRRKPVFSQVSEIRAEISRGSGGKFVPAFVDAFFELSRQEAFWLDLSSSSLDRVLQNLSCLPRTTLSLEHLTDLSQLFALIIDTHNRFTATHSSGVADSAMELATVLGMDRADCLKIRISGYLHDVGKLAVPEKILLKPGKLSTEEWRIVRAHSYYTHQVLERVEGLEDITCWASEHHEELDGGGYPFSRAGDKLSLGSKVVAIADVFTALSEDRPYRAGMQKTKTMAVFKQMVEAGKLDARVVTALFDNFKKITHAVVFAQERELKKLSGFWGFQETVWENYPRHNG